MLKLTLVAWLDSFNVNALSNADPPEQLQNKKGKRCWHGLSLWTLQASRSWPEWSNQEGATTTLELLQGHQSLNVSFPKSWKILFSLLIFWRMVGKNEINKIIYKHSYWVSEIGHILPSFSPPKQYLVKYKSQWYI